MGLGEFFPRPSFSTDRYKNRPLKAMASGRWRLPAEGMTRTFRMAGADPLARAARISSIGADGKSHVSSLIRSP
jgi:hypothetical protein